jgi:hypothetical protein
MLADGSPSYFSISYLVGLACIVLGVLVPLGFIVSKNRKVFVWNA